MTTPTALQNVPGYTTGTWQIDPVHSEVSFSVKHMMVSKVRGSFRNFSGTIITGNSLQDAQVTAQVELASLDTGNQSRDDHVRSADFFDVANHPTMTFSSTNLQGRPDGDYVLTGDLTLKGRTRPVVLDLELNGFTDDPYGGRRVGFSATTTISRSDFGVDLAMPMDGGGVVVSDKVTITLEIEAVLDVADAEEAAVEGAEATLDAIDR